MANKLWDMLAEVRSSCKFVELSHEVSPTTPHWSGFPDMKFDILFDYPCGFYANLVTICTQYGTHADAPSHFLQGKRMLNEFGAEELVLPLCVVDITAKVAENEDYAATREDIQAWEAENGPIPQGAFVALRTDWSKRKNMDNCDAEGNKHYPAWGMSALQYVLEERQAGAIGHETSDTDPPVISAVEGYVGEIYVLEQDRYQIEMLCNLDQLPATGAIIVCAFPRLKDGAGFTARCFAICPKED